MEKYFVTYNKALALKELGFDEPCLAYYEGTGLTHGMLNDIGKRRYLIAPLKSQVFGWFREKHSIHGIVSYYGKGQWNIEILDYKGNELIQIEDNTFWSYKEAESACIDKLIEIVKSKKQ